MCLIALAYGVHDQYPLITIANRDEFHRRPTSHLSVWVDKPNIIAGRDLEQGGTWMGVSKNGRWSAVTNFREVEKLPQEIEFLSRGNLPTDFLDGGWTSLEYLSGLASAKQSYRGFNLLVYDGETLAYFSNRNEDIKVLAPGVYTLSNHLLDTAWPKTEKVRHALQELIAQDAVTPENLSVIFSNKESVTEEELPDTGVGPELERFLAPCFILGEDYGTRNTTSIMFHQQGSIEITEESWLPSGKRQNLASIKLDLS